MLDPDIPKRLMQQPVASALRMEPTEEIATLTKEMKNEKEVGTDVIPVELLKVGRRPDRIIGAPTTSHLHLA